MAASRKKGKRKAGGRWKTTPVWRQWDKEVKSVRKFLKELKESKTMGGEKWRKSMTKHYNQRLAELLDNEPKKYL